MAKILIIDDQITMVDLIRAQLQKINTRLSDEDVFYYDVINGKLSVQSWEQVHGDKRHRIHFENGFPAILSSVCEFLSRYPEEKTLILIDVLLKSDNINAPSIERYKEDQEFSCELYAELIKIKNGKNLPNYSISPDDFFFMLYSRSGASNSVVSAMLRILFKEEETQYFPCECYTPENISWCKNQCEMTDEDNIVERSQKYASQPLVLPDEFEEFIKSL